MLYGIFTYTYPKNGPNVGETFHTWSIWEGKSMQSMWFVGHRWSQSYCSKWWVRRPTCAWSLRPLAIPIFTDTNCHHPKCCIKYYQVLSNTIKYYQILLWNTTVRYYYQILYQDQVNVLSANGSNVDPKCLRHVPGAPFGPARREFADCLAKMVKGKQLPTVLLGDLNFPEKA